MPRESRRRTRLPSLTISERRYPTKPEAVPPVGASIRPFREVAQATLAAQRYGGGQPDDRTINSLR